MGLSVGLMALFSITLYVRASNRDSGSDSSPHNLRFLWQTESENFICCNGGTPEAVGAIRNFTTISSDYTVEESSTDEVLFNCKTFKLSYVARRPKVLSDMEDFMDDDAPKIQCKCPNDHKLLDEHCRRIPPCKNSGVRATSRKCICPSPFFGDQCEKYCDQGQRLTSQNGKDYCSCVPYYQGDECRDVMCLNGGRQDSGRCICPHQFLGYHCEIDANRTGNPHGTRFQRFGDQNDLFSRDVSGTIFSVIMIIVLVLSMYLLMKHRMQHRYLNRRPDLLTACNFPMPMTVSTSQGPNGCLTTTAARRDFIIDGDPRLYSFRPVVCPSMQMPDMGPPPYMASAERPQRSELFPPLPSYEDATKLPALTPGETLDPPEESIQPSVRSESPEDPPAFETASEHEEPQSRPARTDSPVQGGSLETASLSSATSSESSNSKTT